MVLSAAAATVLAGGISAAGGLGSALIGSGSSAISKEDQMEMMKYQNDLNKELMSIQFNYNKWFAQNSYQNAVGDLRKAGLNPLLVSPNGNSGSVGLGSTGVLDPSSTVSSAASMKLAKAQALQGFANTLSNIMLNRSNSAKALADADKSREEIITEIEKQNNLKADTAKKLQETKVIPNSNPFVTGTTILKNIKKDAMSGKSGKQIIKENLPVHLLKDAVIPVSNSSVSFKNNVNKTFWNYADLVNDFHHYAKDKVTGNRGIPFKYYRGLTKDYRIKHDIYNYKDLFK